MGKNKIKVIYLSNWYNALCHNILNNLDDDIDITVILADKFPMIKNNFHNPDWRYKVKVLPAYDVGNYIYFFKKERDNYLLYYKKDLKRFIQETKPDLVIANLIYIPATYQIAKICKKLGIKFVLQTEIKMLPKSLLEKTLFNIYSKIFCKKIIQYSDLIIPWTNDSKVFLENYYKVKGNKIKVIPVGVDSNVFYSDKNKIFLKNNILKILITARLIPFKRHKDLVEAASILRKKGVKFKMTFLGDGILFDEITKLIKSKNLENEIKIITKLPWIEVRKLTISHDLFVLVSYNDAIGIVVPEAMACGLPIIVSDTCGSNMYIEDGKSGFIFKTANVDDLVSKIIRINDKNTLEKFGKESLELIKKKWDIKIVARDYSEIIKKLVKK